MMVQHYDYPPKTQLTDLLELYANAHPTERQAIAKDEISHPLNADEFRRLKEFNWRRKFISLQKAAA